MRNICVCCNIHLPVHFRTYRFHEIGINHSYMDDEKNNEQTRNFLIHQILPVLEIIQHLFGAKSPSFKIAFNVTGPTISLFENYAPSLLRLFNELLSSKHIEFLISPHSSGFLYKKNDLELISQLNFQKTTLSNYLPLASSEFYFNNEEVSQKTMSEINHLGLNPLVFHFSESQQYYEQMELENRMNSLNISINEVENLRQQKHKKRTVQPFENLQLLEEILGHSEKVEFLQINIHYQQNLEKTDQLLERIRNIFNFISRNESENIFLFPSEFINDESAKIHPINIGVEHKAVAINNDLQTETSQYLMYISQKVKNNQTDSIKRDWQLIRDACHLYYMDSHFFNDRYAKSHSNPYSSPYLAFINYTNILEDFNNRLDKF